MEMLQMPEEIKERSRNWSRRAVLAFQRVPGKQRKCGPTKLKKKCFQPEMEHLSHHLF